MLQVPELSCAMGFKDDLILHRGSRRDQVMLLGNAVCPPVMEAVVGALVGREVPDSDAGFRGSRAGGSGRTSGFGDVDVGVGDGTDQPRPTSGMEPEDAPLKMMA